MNPSFSVNTQNLIRSKQRKGIAVLGVKIGLRLIKKSCVFISGQNMWSKWFFGVFLKKMKSPETRGFLFIGTLFDRWVSLKSKGEWRKLFAFTIFFVFCFMLILRLFRNIVSYFLRCLLPCPIPQCRDRRFGFFERNVLNIFQCAHQSQSLQ